MNLVYQKSLSYKTSIDKVLAGFLWIFLCLA